MSEDRKASVNDPTAIYNRTSFVNSKNVTVIIPNNNRYLVFRQALCSFIVFGSRQFFVAQGHH